jgi:hypothetical protein
LLRQATLFLFSLSIGKVIMKSRSILKIPLARLLLAALLAAGMAACGSDGSDGADGTDGVAGTPGSDGLSCWDANQNGIPDMPDEDTNGDGVIDVNDCVVSVPPLSNAEILHKAYFSDNTYEDTSDCLV